MAATAQNINRISLSIPKLLVFVERRRSFPRKAMKDLRQAALLLEALSAYRSDDVLDRWADLLDRGPGWKKRAAAAMRPLREQADLRLVDDMGSRIEASPPPRRARQRR
ncbi:MAG TPA: hypothetical protein VFP44_21175 [Usitatibacter sp.]|nr:hypothetical protein [Usitatibacter sp.]